MNAILHHFEGFSLEVNKKFRVMYTLNSYEIRKPELNNM